MAKQKLSDLLQSEIPTKVPFEKIIARMSPEDRDDLFKIRELYRDGKLLQTKHAIRERCCKAFGISVGKTTFANWINGQ